VLREAPVQTKRWTRVQYERAIDRGIFHEDERLELLDGVLVVKEPQGDRHAVAVDLVALALRRAFGDRWLVRTQVHFASGRLSRPEPDVYVVRGSPRDYLDAAPGNLTLVVEVSDSRLAFDRGLKGAIYARAGIQDYWIVNLVASEVQVYRDPGRRPPTGRGRGYRSIETFRAPSVIAPLAVPTGRIAVADLLP
jgi:Uma2 family endonuclease